MLTVRIQEKNYSESIMVLKLKDGKTEASVCHENGYNKSRENSDLKRY